MCSTSASHDTMDVIDPAHVPSLQAQDSVRAKQWVMCNVFSNTVLTTKGRNNIHDECDSMDVQKVYAAALEYNDLLSISLSATRLCQELTLMKLDDKWARVLSQFWTAKYKT
jgi:hypothetical protein